MLRFWSGAICVIALTLPSCARLRRGGAVNPPVIAAPPTQPPKPVENPQVPPPPKVEQSTANPPLSGSPKVGGQIPAKPPVQVKTVKPKPKPKRPMVAKTIPQPVQPSPANSTQPAGTENASAANPAQTPEPVAVIAPMLSSVQQEAFNRAIDSAVSSAESGLAAVATKQLNQTQRVNAERARSFILQAQEVRGSDLVKAKSFAERAALLAQALVEEIR